jgi:hypothetical protein
MNAPVCLGVSPAFVSGHFIIHLVSFFNAQFIYWLFSVSLNP